MRNVRFLLLGTLFIFCAYIISRNLSKQAVPVVDFDSSMRLDSYPEKLHTLWGQVVYETCKELYERNKKYLVENNSMMRIPHIIHQIWLGSPFPEKYREWQASWMHHHPDWEYRLWTEKEIDQLHMENRDLYDASYNFGEKSDIARYEILYQFGGIYVDTDYECLQSFDELTKAVDFFIGIQPLDTSCVQLGIGIIGSIPRQELLKIVIEKIGFQTTRQIIARTGPLFFTKMFCEYAPRIKGRIMPLPASYLYPRSYYDNPEKREEWMRPESLAVHHWQGSWLEPNAFISGR
jgi:inositol phosphorylceramide mannosyltransferase catalytic subunit